MSTPQILSRLKCVKRSGDGWMARCPVHHDTKASLSIKEGKGGRILIKCHAGCTTESILFSLGLTMKDLFLEHAKQKSKRRLVTTYNYLNEQGTLVFQTVRYDPKDFRQRRPDLAKPDSWIWDLKGVVRILYRLPDVTAAVAAGQSIYIAEGEKDVDALVNHGFTATCNPLGAKLNGSTWLPEHTETLRG